MTKNYHGRYMLLLLFIFSISSVYSQKVGKISQSIKNKDGVYKQIKFDTKQNQIPSSKADQVLQEYLSTQEEDELRPRQELTDKLGFKHVRYQQFYKGVKVEYGTYIVHEKDGTILSMNGDFKKVKGVSLNPSISADAALEHARKYVGASKYLWEVPQEAQLINYEKPQGEIVILENKLAYKFDIYATRPLSRDHIYVDAHSGEILFKNPIIKHAVAHAEDHEEAPAAVATGNAATRYSGTRSISTDSYSGSYRLRDISRGNGVETYDMNNGTSYNSAVDFVDNDNNWTSGEWDNSSKNNAALDAHWGALMTYDYFSSQHGRNSYDNNGAKIRSYVHYSSNYENAFWNGSVMTYGDGATRFDALTSLDVAAHEIGHAVCTNTANLVYSYESGAMNEGFSDIWGAAVEYYAAPEKSEWLIGEDIDKQRPSLRSMIDPKAEGHPDTYKGINWHTSSSDNGGVHVNSGVLNHWFYILSDGKTGTNDIGNSYSVAGIGIGKAAEIAYRLEAVYLSSNSQYADARNYGIQAAEDLFGADSPEAIATQNAWYAVGIGSEYGGGGGGTCATGTVTLTLVLDNYPEETSWTLTNSGGSTVASGGTYGSQPDGSTVTETFNIAAGDYTFTITDAYGDGICCSYGNGSYTLSDNGSGSILASGGSFGSSDAVSFCVEGGGGDTEAPTAPGSLTASNITTSGADLSWSASTDNVDVTGYDVYVNGSLDGSTTNTSYTISGLSPATGYTASVKAKDAAGNESAASTVSFTTDEDATPISYCTSNGNNVNYEWIDLVELGSMVNATGANNGYGDFTGMTANVSRGGAHTIYFSVGFSGSSYTEYWRVWIDFNQDGDFSDSGEQLVAGSSSSSGKLSGTLNIPSNALLGQTRMRVSMRYNAAPASCGTFSYGEVEDYTVNITNSFAGISNMTASKDGENLGNEAPTEYFVTYPNPAEDFVEVRISDRAIGYSMKMMHANGTIIENIKSADHTVRIDMSKLPAGIYIISMKTPREMVNRKIVKY